MLHYRQKWPVGEMSGVFAISVPVQTIQMEDQLLKQSAVHVVARFAQALCLAFITDP